MKLTDGLYAYVWQGNDNNCNTYIFAGVLNDNKHIIIDPGHITTPYTRERAYETLVRQITADGLKLEDIGLVFITHAHPDHIEGARKFKDLSSAKIILHKDDARTYNMFGGGKVDVLVEEGDLQVDNLVREKLEVIHTPGHSPGEVCLYWPAQKALAVGDVVFYRNIGRVDLPGGSPGLLLASLEKLSHLDVEYLLCGHPYGHPGVLQGKEEIRKNFDYVKSFFD